MSVTLALTAGLGAGRVRKDTARPPASVLQRQA